jgi:hypothetical protein
MLFADTDHSIAGKSDEIRARMPRKDTGLAFEHSISAGRSKSQSATARSNVHRFNCGGWFGWIPFRRWSLTSGDLANDFAIGRSTRMKKFVFVVIVGNRMDSFSES